MLETTQNVGLGAQVLAFAKSKKRNKYGAIRTEVDGITFASRREAKHYQELKLRLKAGEITNLVLQPTYKIEINGQHICKVVLDFYYQEGGHEHTIDVKGRDNRVSKIKRKMVEALYGIEVEIV